MFCSLSGALVCVVQFSHQSFFFFFFYWLSVQLRPPHGRKNGRMMAVLEWTLGGASMQFVWTICVDVWVFFWSSQHLEVYLGFFFFNCVPHQTKSCLCFCNFEYWAAWWMKGYHIHHEWMAVVIQCLSIWVSFWKFDTIVVCHHHTLIMFLL